MKAKKILMFAVLISFIGLCSCKEDSISTFDGDDFVYFGSRVDYLGNTLWDNSMLFNFSHARPGLIDTTINIRVLTGGNVVANHDRTFHVRSIYEGGTSGVHYETVSQEQTILQGRNYGYVPVRLLYNPDLDEETMKVRLELIPSPDFPGYLPLNYVSADQRSYDRTYYEVEYTAELTPPALYEQYMTTFTIIGYWSPAKFHKMNEVWGTTMADWLDKDSQLTANINIYLVVFGIYLNEQVALGPEAAIKDPSPESTRGYMTLKGSNSLGVPGTTIPASFPDAY